MNTYDIENKCFIVEKPPKPKSVIKIGKERMLRIEVDTKFNRLQKIMWKILLNIDIEDAKEE